jgi:hypothetical protein
MPATDVLNPVAGWTPAEGDSINPSYNFVRNRPSTLLRKKPIGGHAWERETQNTGHIFELGWTGRTWPIIQRIKWYYEQYERGGVFTFKNHDAGGREYVGKFISISQETETANNKWNISAVFEEAPAAAMVNYPSDWDHDSVLFLVNNDWSEQQLATNDGGLWTETTVTTMPAITLGGRLRGTGGLALSNVAMTNPGTNTTDWATYEYRGYGFKLWLSTGPNYGKADVYLDEVLVNTVDCYNAAAVGPAAVLVDLNVPLDIHRVTVVTTNTKNASSSATTIKWWGLQVMR